MHVRMYELSYWVLFYRFYRRKRKVGSDKRISGSILILLPPCDVHYPKISPDSFPPHF